MRHKKKQTMNRTGDVLRRRESCQTECRASNFTVAYTPPIRMHLTTNLLLRSHVFYLHDSRTTRRQVVACSTSDCYVTADQRRMHTDLVTQTSIFRRTVETEATEEDALCCCIQGVDIEYARIETISMHVPTVHP